MSMVISQLRAWAPMAAKGYEVPAAGQVMLNAANELEAQATLITELVGALEGLIARYDPEDAGAAFDPDPGCLQCTQGVTPNDKATGQCPYHKALSVLAKFKEPEACEVCGGDCSSANPPMGAACPAKAKGSEK